MNYSEYVSTVANLCVLAETIVNPNAANPSSDDNFNQILPQAINYAEQRMYRELDLLGTFTSSTANFTAFNRSLAVPGDLIVVQSVNVISPAGSAPTSPTAVRNPLIRTTQEWLNYLWPQGQVSDGGLPKYYAMPNDETINVAPAPAYAYTAEFYGTYRPAPLSSTNTATLLTTYAPSAFVLCSLIFFSAYQRYWSQQSDDPAMAQSYESQYGKAKAAIDVEAARQKSQGPQWSALSPTMVATPPRQ